jgi:hypothetical protein
LNYGARPFDGTTGRCSLAGFWRGRDHFISVRTADPTSPHDAPRYANPTLHADVAVGIRELMRADTVGSRALVRVRIRRVVGYCAKLGRRRVGDDDVDLFTVLPTPMNKGPQCVEIGPSASRV